MERLTDKESRNPICSEQGGLCVSTKFVRRLAAYEDIGLEPEKIIAGKELAEIACVLNLLKQYQVLGPVEELTALVKAQDEGRVVVLPCNQQELLEMLDDLASVDSEDSVENYTTGYRNGHRNGRIELLRYILQIPDSSRDTYEM